MKLAYIYWNSFWIYANFYIFQILQGNRPAFIPCLSRRGDHIHDLRLHHRDAQQVLEEAHQLKMHVFEISLRNFTRFLFFSFSSSNLNEFYNTIRFKTSESFSQFLLTINLKIALICFLLAFSQIE